MQVFVVTVFVTIDTIDDDDDFSTDTTSTLIGVYESYDSARAAITNDVNDTVRGTDQKVKSHSAHAENDDHNDYYSVWEYLGISYDGFWCRRYCIYPAFTT